MKALSRRLSGLILIYIFLLNSCISPHFPDYWDKEEGLEFALTESPYPSSPDAVIIFDLERISINKQEWSLIRKHHKRLHIFTEEGKKYADIRIPFYHTHKVTEIKAQTILPDGRRIKLESSNIYEEGEEDGWRYKIFALPGVEENCIIEYQYKYSSKNLSVIRPKYFQSDLYTEYSMLKLTLPNGFTYHGVTRNEPVGFIEPEGVEVHLPDNRNECYYVWEVHDLEPIKNEAYVYNRQDHLFSLQMQLVSYVDAFNNITFIKEWDDMLERLLEFYSSYLQSSGALRKLYTVIEEASGDQKPTPRDIYIYVRENFKSADYKGLGVDDMGDIIKSQVGTRIEKNLLLAALLQEAGYEAVPVIISRRSNGRINKGSPSINEFDHVIVGLKTDKQYHMIDAGSLYASFDFMPSTNYSGMGLMIAKGSAQFVEFSSTPPLSQRDILTTVELDEKGSLKGNIKIKSTGYYASNLRGDYADAKDEETFVYDDIVNHLPGIVIDSIDVKMNTEDRSEPVWATIYFNIPDYLSPAGDMIYLPSFIYNRFDRNPLTNERRTHPVEFSYPKRSKETINLKIPEGWEVIEIPENGNVRGPGLGFQKLSKVDGRDIQISWYHQLNKLVHGSQDYKQIKSFYTESVALDQRMIVLKRTDT